MFTRSYNAEIISGSNRTSYFLRFLLSKPTQTNSHTHTQTPTHIHSTSQRVTDSWTPANCGKWSNCSHTQMTYITHLRWAWCVVWFGLYMRDLYALLLWHVNQTGDSLIGRGATYDPIPDFHTYISYGWNIEASQAHIGLFISGLVAAVRRHPTPLGGKVKKGICFLRCASFSNGYSYVCFICLCV